VNASGLVCILLPVLLAQPSPFTEAVPAQLLPHLSATERRGEHLVTKGGCHDCHTPGRIAADAVVPDMARMLSGHPEQLKVPNRSRLPKLWAIVAASLRTAFTGPWGTSFGTNLTPDRETGLGGWTEQDFIEVMRTGQHRGRKLLPPMPVGQYGEADLKAIWAYLRRVPAIRNQVPSPQRPPEGATAGAPAR